MHLGLETKVAALHRKKLVSHLATLPMVPLCLPWVTLFSNIQVARIESIRGKVKLRVKAPHNITFGKEGTVIFLSGYLVKV